MVVLSELSSLFVKISICDALLSFNFFNASKVNVLRFNSRNQNNSIKLSPSTKSATADEIIAKKHKEAVSNVDHCDEIKITS